MRKYLRCWQGPASTQVPSSKCPRGNMNWKVFPGIETRQSILIHFGKLHNPDNMLHGKNYRTIRSGDRWHVQRTAKLLKLWSHRVYSWATGMAQDEESIINKIYHIKRLKGKSHDYLHGCQKASEKIQHLALTKILNKLGIDQEPLFQSYSQHHTWWELRVHFALCFLRNMPAPMPFHRLWGMRGCSC